MSVLSRVLTSAPTNCEVAGSSECERMTEASASGSKMPVLENRMKFDASAALTDTFKSWLFAIASATASSSESRIPSVPASGTARGDRSPGRAEMTAPVCAAAIDARPTSRPAASRAERTARVFGNLFIPLLLRHTYYALRARMFSATPARGAGALPRAAPEKAGE
jgi:hypothetical protein